MRTIAAYIVDVQALSIHTNHHLVPLPLLQAAKATHRRCIYLPFLRVQRLWQRSDDIRRLHCACYLLLFTVSWLVSRSPRESAAASSLNFLFEEVAKSWPCGTIPPCSFRRPWTARSPTARTRYTRLERSSINDVKRVARSTFTHADHSDNTPGTADGWIGRLIWGSKWLLH